MFIIIKYYRKKYLYFLLLFIAVLSFAFPQNLHSTQWQAPFWQPKLLLGHVVIKGHYVEWAALHVIMSNNCSDKTVKSLQRNFFSEKSFIIMFTETK